ncbi:uncharacterized protein LOC133372649 [Rhineura floridana]|uniref:uncharacterized protein LOC133372649 n=1 Tax=Rhineura floridana TaxID=261503 RepID=UPI002AC83909|nr:uncharacterized protein LOC133372649 [Rhineura floridana]
MHKIPSESPKRRLGLFDDFCKGVKDHGSSSGRCSRGRRRRDPSGFLKANGFLKGLNCCEYKHQMTCTGCYEAAPQRNMSCVEHARKLQLAGGTLEGATMKVATQRKLQLSDAQWQLRMKFLQRPKSYIGVPYAWKYHEPRRKRQPHDIHVEIWLGDRERSIGARWKRGKLQVFASYKFVSSSYGAMQYHFKSIETWLQGVCIRQVSVMLKIRRFGTDTREGPFHTARSQTVEFAPTRGSNGH